MVGRPPAHRGELSLPPHELAGDRAVVAALVVDAVAGGQHVVEPEPVGEWPDHVVGGGGGEDEGATVGAVVLEERPGEGLHRRGQEVGRLLARGLDLRTIPSLGEPGGLPRQDHRRPGLPHQVEQAVEETFPGDRPIGDHAGLAQRRAEHGTTGPAQQGPIQIEEHGAAHRRNGNPPADPPLGAARRNAHPPKAAAHQNTHPIAPQTAHERGVARGERRRRRRLGASREKDRSRPRVVRSAPTGAAQRWRGILLRHTVWRSGVGGGIRCAARCC